MSRRSSRARKPKQFEDSICYTGKRKSVNEENKAKTSETSQGKYSEKNYSMGRVF